MSIFTEQEIDAQMIVWKAALTAVGSGQEYELGNRKLKRADLQEIRDTLTWLDQEKNNAAGTGGPVFLPGRPKR